MSNLAPGAQTGTYPIVEEVMQLSRALTNDMLRDTGGRILTDTAPFTIPYLNSAIRRTQRYFANNGLENYIKDNVIVPGIPPAKSTDPSVQVYLSSNGYFDGVTLNAQPTLPADLIVPLAVSQRQTGSGGQFTIVTPTRGDGLASRIPGTTFDEWEWRNDNLNFVGATLQMDLRLRYEGMIPALAPGSNFLQTAIPLRDAHEALAAWVVYFYAFARGSKMLVAGNLRELATQEMDEVINRFVRKDQRIAYRSKGFQAGGGPIDGALSGSYK